MSKHLCTRSVEFRAAEPTDGSDGRTMEGYAAVWDAPTEINSWEGRFTETLSRGAFKKTLAERKPVLQFDHGHDSRVGSTPIGHFTELREDDDGLYCQARLFDNPIVEPVRQAIEAGAVSGMSFRFKPVRDEWRDAQGKLVKPDELGRLLYDAGDRGPLQRNIKEVQLFEAGPVVFPAYPQTSVGVRSMTDEDREALVAEYRRTAVDEDEERVMTTADVPGAKPEEPASPAAPNVDKSTPETPAPDAVREDTSEPAGRTTPEDAAPKGTSTGLAENEIRKVEPKVKTLEELRARLAEIAVRMEEIGEETRDAELDAETQTEYDGLKEEEVRTEASIRKIEERMADLKARAVAKPAATESGNGAPAFHKKQGDELYDLGELRAMSYSGDDFLERVTDNAKRAIERAKFGVRGKEDAQAHAEELLEEVDNSSRDLAKRYLLTGSAEYERGFAKVMRHGSDAFCSPEERQALIRAAQSLGSDANGGYAVPFQLDPTVILTSAGVVNPIRQLARIERIVGKEWQGVTSAGTTVQRGAEGAVAPDSGFTLAQPTVTTNRVQGFVQFTMEVDLAWNALRSEITRQLIDAKGREEESFTTGDGTGTNPQGINVSLTGQDVTTAAVDTFAVGDVYALEEALDARWEPNASWLAHKTVYNAIRQFSPNGQGSNFWVTLGDGTPPRLLDYPDYRSTALPTLTAAKASGTHADGTDTLMLFGDFSQFLIVDRIGMTVEMIPHVFDQATGFPKGVRGVYAVWMNNSKILVPGAFKRLVDKQS